MCGYPGWENNEVLYGAMKSNASFLLVFDVSSFCKDGKDLVSPVILQLFNLFQQIHIRIGNCEIQLCVVLHMLPIFGLGKHRRAKLQIILQARLRDVHMTEHLIHHRPDLAGSEDVFQAIPQEIGKTDRFQLTGFICVFQCASCFPVLHKIPVFLFSKFFPWRRRMNDDKIDIVRVEFPKRFVDGGRSAFVHLIFRAHFRCYKNLLP